MPLAAYVIPHVEGPDTVVGVADQKMVHCTACSMYHVNAGSWYVVVAVWQGTCVGVGAV